MNTSDFGKKGELYARDYLERKGYSYVVGNYKKAHGEIDLIMKDGDTLVFVEVKSRRSRRYGEPVEAVNPRKQVHIKYCAQMYVLDRRIQEKRIRFDIVEVMASPSGVIKFRHIKNAF